MKKIKEKFTSFFKPIVKVLNMIGKPFKTFFKYIGKGLEKNDLVKWISIILIIAVATTWLLKIPVEETSEFYRIGLLDFFTIGVIGINLYAPMFTFLIVVAGFYELLGKTKSYRLFIDKLTKKINKKSDFFVLYTMLFFAILSAIFVDSFAVLFFVPLFIALILNLNYDKLTAFLATFGGMLVGTIGSLYNGKVFGQLVLSLGVKYQENAIYRFGLFVAAFILLAIFTISHIKKTAKSNKKDKDLLTEKVNELFVVEKPKRNEKKRFATILFILLALFVIVSSIPWSTAFGSLWPTKFNQWFNEFKIFDVKFLQYVTGYNLEMGKWDLFGIQAVILFVSVIITFVSKLSFSDYIDSFVDGVKKISKPLFVLFMVMFVKSITVYYPAIEALFIAMMKNFNYFIAAIIAFIASIFGVDMGNTWTLSGARMLTTFGGNIANDKMAVIYQAVHGLSQFVAPTSIFLMLGLSFLDIPYLKWIRKTWMLLLGILIVTIAAVVLVTQL